MNLERFERFYTFCAENFHFESSEASCEKYSQATWGNLFAKAFGMEIRNGVAKQDIPVFVVTIVRFTIHTLDTITKRFIFVNLDRNIVSSM